MILKNYMYTAPSVFTAQEIAEIHKIAKSIPVDTARTGHNNTDPDFDESLYQQNTSIRQGEVKWFSPPQFPMPQNIVDKINEQVQNAMDVCEWPFALDWIENFQYTIYNAREDALTGDFYTWHTDHGGETNYCDRGFPSHRKISMTIQLSDPDDYEGGKFQWLEPNSQFDRMQRGKTKIDVDTSIRTLPFSCQALGSMCLFPSFLYHQVTPVTRGTRVSIVGWYNGPPWT